MLNLLNQTREYSGTFSYRYIEKLIDTGSKVLIVSPYIDEYYANYLINRGVSKKIYVIASSVNERVVRKLSDGKKRMDPVYAFLLIAIFTTLLLYFEVPYIYVLIFVIAASSAALAIAVYGRGKKSSVEFKKPSRFIHAKLYISERMAIEGSANLTYKGLHSNLEYIKITYDKAEIKEMEKRFWEIWNSV